MNIRADVHGYYWTFDNELRECVVITMLGELHVIDLETTEVLDLDPDDVMIERPDT